VAIPKVEIGETEEVIKVDHKEILNMRMSIIRGLTKNKIKTTTISTTKSS